MAAMKTLRDCGLTLALAALFSLSVGGMVWSGWISAGEDARIHADIAPTLLQYVGSGDFMSALFENWESEFLQMGVYVVLTAMLFQRGSAESRDPDSPGRGNDDANPGVIGWLYAHSLGLVLGLLFLASFGLHAVGSWRKALESAVRHGQPVTGSSRIFPAPICGSSPCRTGSRSFCPPACSWCCRSTCGTGARPSPSPCRRRMARRVSDDTAAVGLRRIRKGAYAAGFSPGDCMGSA